MFLMTLCLKAVLFSSDAVYIGTVKAPLTNALASRLTALLTATYSVLLNMHTNSVFSPSFRLPAPVTDPFSCPEGVLLQELQLYSDYFCKQASSFLTSELAGL